VIFLHMPDDLAIAGAEVKAVGRVFGGFFTGLEIACHSVLDLNSPVPGFFLRNFAHPSSPVFGSPELQERCNPGH